MLQKVAALVVVVVDLVFAQIAKSSPSVGQRLRPILQMVKDRAANWKGHITPGAHFIASPFHREQVMSLPVTGRGAGWATVVVVVEAVVEVEVDCVVDVVVDCVVEVVVVSSKCESW
jgi:hypothetical protein